MYDLIIIGGGPAGVAAGVYAARKKMKLLVITDSFGGQSLVSADVQNWIGTKSVSGFDLGKMLEEHLRAQEGIEIVFPDAVKSVEALPSGGFTVTAESGASWETKFLFVASGSRRRKLGIPGEKELDGRGVAYCSTCDAPLFNGKDVAVVGGGNAGLEAVVDLLPYANKVYLLEYSDHLKGDPITQEKVKSSPKVQVMFNVQSLAVVGEQFVTGLKYKDVSANEEKELPLGGVFVEIGAIPNKEFLGNLVEYNKFGEIVVDHKTQQSSNQGIWAAGDVTDVLYKQNNISAGDAVKAVLNIYERIVKGE